MARLSKNPDTIPADKICKSVFSVFEKNRNEKNAEAMSAYMKNHFPFLGISSPERKELQKQFWINNSLPSFETVKELIPLMFQNPYREMHYAAIDAASKFTKTHGSSLLTLAEWMIGKNSWWDSVDGINSSILRPVFKNNSELKNEYTGKWILSDNLWYRRSALISQLGFREKTDAKLLSRYILLQNGSKEFFINKAIGWALRDYAYTNPDWVRQFVAQNELHPLSKREALKKIN